jgi:hypothetical protein
MEAQNIDEASNLVVYLSTETLFSITVIRQFSRITQGQMIAIGVYCGMIPQERIKLDD